MICCTGVDAGSEWTRVVVLALENGRVRWLGHAERRSEGWADSRIADVKAVAASIQAALEEAAARAQVPLTSAVVGAGGTTVGCAVSRGGYEEGYCRNLEQHDVDLVIERASRVQFGEDQMPLHICLRDFVLDGRAGVRDPRGQSAVHLEAFVSLVTFSTREHDALVNAANSAGVVVEETVFEPIAAAYACVRREQRRAGVAVIDIGADSTDLVVYQGDSLALARGLPLGGQRFSKDLAQGLSLSLEEAEMLKLQYGSLVAGENADQCVIELPVPPGRPPREAPRSELAFILEARADQLFRLVRRELRRAGLEASLLGGVVLCGGAARLEGLCEVAERVLNCQVAWGVPVGIRDWPTELMDVSWATAAGLAMYSGRLKQRRLERERRGLLSKVFG